MAITAVKLRRLEIWTNFACAGGVRLADITAYLQACSGLENFQGGDKLSLTVELTVPFGANLIEGAVLRVDQDDTPTWDEWRVVNRVEDTLAGTIMIEAVPSGVNILTEAGIVRQVLASGEVLFDFDSVGLTATQQITNFLLPSLPGYITIGTITPTQRVDTSYSWDTPYAALQRIVSLCQNCELDIRRNGTAGYTINIVTSVNSGAALTDLRSGRNLTQLKRTRTRLQQATRIYPRGAKDQDSVAATMAGALWLVSAVSGVNITLADAAGGNGPIQFDTQLNGLLLNNPRTGINNTVTASLASTQQVATAASSWVVVGDYVYFTSAVASELAFLDSPADMSVSGIRVGILDRSDIPGTNNYLRNSAMRTWPGSMPTGWNIQSNGGITCTKQTAAPFTMIGGASVKCVSTTDGEGIISDYVTVPASALLPYISGYARVWVTTGQVRVELLFNTPQGIVVRPVLPNVATNQSLGLFEDVGVSNESNQLNLAGPTDVAIRIVQHGATAATFYIDAAQITNTVGQETFVEVSGATQLWQAANEQLRMNAGVYATYEATMHDLARLDPVTWSLENPPLLGAPIRVIETSLPVSIQTRIMEVDRNYLVPGATRIVLSNSIDDLIGTFARQPRPDRAAQPITDLSTAPLVTSVSIQLNTAGNAVMLVTIGGAAISFKIAVSSSGIPADSTVEATSAINSQAAVVTSAGTFTPGQTIYGKAFAYTGLNGTGRRSSAITFQFQYAQAARGAAFSDGKYALIADNAAGTTANSSVTDSSGSSARAINLSFAKVASGNPDSLQSIPNDGLYNKGSSSYIDSNGRLVVLYRSTGTDTIDADTIGGQFGNIPANLILSGGGQDGALGAQTPNWTKGAGVNLVPTNATSKIADRCLSITHPTNNFSWHTQTAVVKAGVPYFFCAWIRLVSTVSVNTDGAYIQFTPGSGTINELDNHNAGVHSNSTGFTYFGVGFTGGDTGWIFVQSVFIPSASATGTIYIGLATNSGTPRIGTAYFDGVTLQELPPNVTLGGSLGKIGLDANGNVQVGVLGAATINGSSAATVATGGVRANTGLDASGRLQTGVNSGTDINGSSSNTVATGGVRAASALDSSNSLITDVDSAATLANGNLLASQLARQTSGYFVEVFNIIPATPDYSGSFGTMSLTTNGTNGKFCLRSTGNTTFIYGPALPYNQSKIYRMRARVRQVTDPSSGGKNFYFGLRGVTQTGAATNTNGGNNYFVSSGLTTTVAEGWVELVGWVRGATLASTSASNASSRQQFTPTNLAAMNTGTTQVYPIIGVNYLNGNGVAEIDYVYIDEFDEDGSLRTYTGFSGNGVLDGGVAQGDASGSRVMIRGRQTGTARNGDTITFVPPFQNTPIWRATGGALNEPRAKWGTNGDGTESGAVFTTPQYEDFALISASGSGGTVRARLRQKGSTTTTITDTWGAGNTITDVSFPAYTSFRLLTSTPAVSDFYQINISATITFGYDNTHINGLATQTTSILAAVDVDTNSTGTWIEVGTYTFSKSGSSTAANGTSSYSTTVGVTRTGLTTTSRFRVRNKAFTDTTDAQGSATLTAVTVVHGFVSGSADQYASKTPDSADFITWEAYEASST